MRRIWKTLIFLITGCWIGFIVWAAVQPFSRIKFATRHFTDVDLHVMGFVILAFMLCGCFFALTGVRYTRKRELAGALAAALLSCGFGGFTEGIQQLTLYRTPDWLDFKCDLAGASFGIAFYILFSRIHYFKKRLRIWRGFAKRKSFRLSAQPAPF